MLKLQILNRAEQEWKLNSLPLTLGRDPANQIVLDDPKISDFHAEIHADEKGLYLIDLLSISGSFINDLRVADRQRLKAWDQIRLGTTVLELVDANSSRPSAWALVGEGSLNKRLELSQAVTTVGRDPSCEFCIESAMLSRKHAELRVDGDVLRVSDLHSRNGTYINGQRIQNAIARPGDELRFDEQTFRVHGPHTLEDTEQTGLRHRVQMDDTVYANTCETETPISDPKSAQLDVDNLGLITLDESLSIGRANDNDLVIADPSISKQHARVFFKQGHWHIEDLHSRNGTSVNGVAVQTQRLSHEDHLCLGKVNIIFLLNVDLNNDTQLIQR